MEAESGCSQESLLIYTIWVDLQHSSGASSSQSDNPPWMRSQVTPSRMAGKSWLLCDLPELIMQADFPFLTDLSLVIWPVYLSWGWLLTYSIYPEVTPREVIKCPAAEKSPNRQLYTVARKNTWQGKGQNVLIMTVFNVWWWSRYWDDDQNNF